MFFLLAPSTAALAFDACRDTISSAESDARKYVKLVRQANKHIRKADDLGVLSGEYGVTRPKHYCEQIDLADDLLRKAWENLASASKGMRHASIRLSCGYEGWRGLDEIIQSYLESRDTLEERQASVTTVLDRICSK
ncbi:MAG: hypothetical protein COB37_06250 [Kordiimonadales bacterium]|nr:MAG: hypothetical protein COB37_06250 [Kordiimonadales bacterium]